ncbi:NHL repeat-containing protein [bacterium]|nr:NHL repeat-containing protein [bacterium]
MGDHSRSVSAVLVIAWFFCAGALSAQESRVPLQLRYTGSWGGTGSEKGRLHQARAIAVDPAGDVFICDTGNHRIQKFSLYGRFIVHAGGFGWGEDQFDRPVSITARNGLDVYVADVNTNRILRYDKDCHFISVFSPADTDDGDAGIEYPEAVDINPLGELYILDSINKKAVKYDRTGMPVVVFGDFGGGEGRLRDPADLHVDGSGKVLIADRGEHCLKVYDMYGNYLHDIGRDADMDPGTVTTIASDYIICADHMAPTIRLFSGAGVYAGILDTGIPGLVIADIAVYQRFLAVLDAGTDTVYLFTIADAGE